VCILNTTYCSCFSDQPLVFWPEKASHPIAQISRKAGNLSRPTIHPVEEKINKDILEWNFGGQGRELEVVP
jgi:hypothetical protein